MWSFVIPPKNTYDFLLTRVKVSPVCRVILEYASPMSLFSCDISFSNILPRLPVLECYFSVRTVEIGDRMEECTVTPEIRRGIYERMCTGELPGEIAINGFLGYDVEKFKVRLYDDLFYIRTVISNPIRNSVSFSNEDYSYTCALCGRYRQVGFKVCSGHILDAMMNMSTSELYRDIRREICEIWSREEKKEITDQEIDDTIHVPGMGRCRVHFQLVWCRFSPSGKGDSNTKPESDWEKKMRLETPLAEKVVI